MTAQRAAALSLITTTLLVVAKVVAGLQTGSVAVLSEGLQSFADVMIAAGVLLSIRWAAKPPDDDHPYGHGKAEVVMSAFQMLVVVATAGFIISQALQRLQKPQQIEPDFGIWVMAISLAVNLAMAAMMVRVSKKTGSSALAGEAIHLRGDAAASLGVLLGLVVVRQTGWLAFDPIIAMVFAVMVILSALNQFRHLLHPLMDGALSPDQIQTIEHTLDHHPAVKGYHNLRTRQVGSTRVIDLHVLLDDGLSFIEAHDLAENVEDSIRNAIGSALVNVHYEPYATELKHQREVHGANLEP